MTLAQAIQFDDPPRGSGDADGLRAIHDALGEQPVVTLTGLYDESLTLATDGHLGQARDRLRMLLCLDPHDGDAHLLLGKVFAAQGRWPDALSQLDAAGACGVPVPEALRRTVEAGLQVERADDHGERVAARAQSELRALREETRRLRSENARLSQQIHHAERRSQRWAVTTAAVAGVCALLLAATLVLGPTPDEAEPVAEVPAAAPAPAARPAVAPAGPAARTYTVVSGDNLSKVAEKVYGQSTRWKDIAAANQDQLNGSIDLQVGMVLRIPE